jgi:hypothetical protein
MLNSTSNLDWLWEDPQEGQFEEDDDLLAGTEVDRSSAVARQFHITNMQQWIDLNA